MFAYCYNNPVALTDDSGYAPEWWQWAVSGAMVIGGIVLTATGVGGVAGGALICSGANSIINSYISEYTGTSSSAGWWGGLVSGAICGAGAGIAGNLFTAATESVGLQCLGKLALGGTVAFGTGFSGSIVGQMTSSAICGDEFHLEDSLLSASLSGSLNCLSGIAAGMGNALYGLPSFTQTSKQLAGMLTTGWSIFAEVVVDSISTVASLF